MQSPGRRRTWQGRNLSGSKDGEYRWYSTWLRSSNWRWKCSNLSINQLRVMNICRITFECLREVRLSSFWGKATYFTRWSLFFSHATLSPCPMTVVVPWYIPVHPHAVQIILLSSSDVLDKYETCLMSTLSSFYTRVSNWIEFYSLNQASSWLWFILSRIIIFPFNSSDFT